MTRPGIGGSVLARVVALFLCTAPHILAAGTSTAADALPSRWGSFRSSAGFSLQYPVDWVRKDVPKDQLLILSSEGGAGAAVIKPGQALLSVVESQDEQSNLQQLRDRYNRGITILARKHIRAGGVKAYGCRDLYEVISKEPAVPPGDTPRPGPALINTEFFCEIGGKKYVTVLRNFEGDEKQTEYQDVALRVAQSLRAEEPRY
jgi:hypothetical protein